MAKRGTQAVGNLLKKGSSSSLRASAEAVAKSFSSATTPKLSSSKPDRHQRTPFPAKLGADIKPNTGSDRASSPQTERPDLGNTERLWTMSEGVEIHISKHQSERSAHSLFFREKNIRECEKRFNEETVRHVEKVKEDLGKEIVKVIAMDGSGYSTIDRPDQQDQAESDKTSPLWNGSLSSTYKGKGKGRK
ncbi:hypothetical protein BKA80DRAFT_307273 [Phyllosticta citrichinensis]